LGSTRTVSITGKRSSAISGRYKALHVDGSGNGYLKTVCDYVHLNPARAGLLGPEEPLQSYPWSSYPLHLQEPTRRPVWLRVGHP
jgi:hypothetical protein